MPRSKVIHGRWGEVLQNGQVLAEVTGIEYTTEIERIEVPQTGSRWNAHTEGVINGSGTLRMNKVYSRFEDAIVNYVSKTAAELRAMRDAGVDPRPALQLLVVLDSPHAYGRESETLDGVLFWSYSGGYSLTELVGREFPFTFEGITPGQRIPVPTIP